jgi:hypothetical protein
MSKGTTLRLDNHTTVAMCQAQQHQKRKLRSNVDKKGLRGRHHSPKSSKSTPERHTKQQAIHPRFSIQYTGASKRRHMHPIPLLAAVL